MHEVIRRVAEEAALELSFDTSDPDSLSPKETKALKHNKAAKLVNGLIDRGVVKRTVMTSVYGVTYVGARQQIQEKIEEKVRTLNEALLVFVWFRNQAELIASSFVEVGRKRLRHRRDGPRSVCRGWIFGHCHNGCDGGSFPGCQTNKDVVG